jgi:hypothetical protein
MDRNFEIQSDLILPNLLNILCKNSIGNLMNDIKNENKINYKALDYDNRSILHIAARDGATNILK